MKAQPNAAQAALIDRIQAETDPEEARELIHELFESGYMGEAISRRSKGSLRFTIRALDVGEEHAPAAPAIPYGLYRA